MRSQPRFAIDDDPAGEGSNRTVRITGRELHHMREVMRLGIGAEVVLLSAAGREYAGRIISYEPDAAIVRIGGILARRPDPAPRLILAAGIIKAARMNILVEKAAELNAAEFWPLKCARSVVRDPSAGRHERWCRIALAATKQSQRPSRMAVSDAVDLTTMLERVPPAAFRVVCLQGAAPLASILLRRRDSLQNSPAIVLAVGPEGDFTDEELNVLRHAGFVAAALGESRLRSETAALAALSLTGGILAGRQEVDSS
jgi:16S rRNA (uracil1498-N3)-methyltransferase